MNPKLDKIIALLEKAVGLLQDLLRDRNDRGAFDLPSFAKWVSLSTQQVRNHIEAGDLVPSYSKSKPLITKEEAIRFLRSLPPERP